MELLECIKDDGYHPEALKFIENFPVKGEVYTIRRSNVRANGDKGYILEEVRNPLMPDGIEPGFHKSRFRVIEQDPINIESLLKETEQLETI